jgi:hypothetical protein
VSPVLLADVLNVQPNSSSLPGFDTAQNLVGGLQLGTVLLCVAAVFVGAAAWAIGSHSSNYRASGGGKLAIVAGGLGALLVGFGPTLVQTLFHIGQAAH